MKPEVDREIIRIARLLRREGRARIDGHDVWLRLKDEAPGTYAHLKRYCSYDPPQYVQAVLNGAGLGHQP